MCSWTVGSVGTLDDEQFVSGIESEILIVEARIRRLVTTDSESVLQMETDAIVILEEIEKIRWWRLFLSSFFFYYLLVLH